MRICLTGGIGAGKSYVCRILRERGVEIYDTDNAAKRLIAESPQIRQRLKDLVGGIEKQAIAAFLLKSEENKLAINNIVHPAVIEDFLKSGYEWMECAIIYEAHLEQYVDKINRENNGPRRHNERESRAMDRCPVSAGESSGKGGLRNR